MNGWVACMHWILRTQNNKVDNNRVRIVIDATVSLEGNRFKYRLTMETLLIVFEALDVILGMLNLSNLSLSQ